MNEPENANADRASVTSTDVNPPAFDEAAMTAACKAAIDSCAKEMAAFEAAAKVRAGLDEVHRRLVERAATTRATLDVARAQLGNAEASQMLAEASAEIDGGAPPTELSAPIESARRECVELTASLGRIDAALAIVPDRMREADEELERTGTAFKQACDLAVTAVRDAQEDLMTAAAGPLASALVVGFALHKAGVCRPEALLKVELPRLDHRARPILSNGHLIPRDGEDMKLEDHIPDVPLATALQALLQPLGQARRASDRELSRIDAARRHAQHQENEARRKDPNRVMPPAHSLTYPAPGIPDRDIGMGNITIVNR